MKPALIPNRPAEEVILRGAAVAAMVALVPVLLYQTGRIQTLPEIPSSLFASDRITASRVAHPFGIPDSALGLVNFGMTLALMSAARKNFPARKVLGWKLLADGAAGSLNAARQITRFGKLCSLCMGTALAAEIMLCAGRSLLADSLGGNWSCGSQS